MSEKEIVSWLLEGDVSIQYQVYRDLLGKDKPRLRRKIEMEGWGSQFLACRNPNGHWGQKFYQPKWISTHYTLLDLKNLAIAPGNKKINESLQQIFKNLKAADGGILPIGAERKSDVCINGMVLNYASYFQVDKMHLKSIVDFLLVEKMNDGGFNCLSNRIGATHSSLHSTISVLEGIFEYEQNGYHYRLPELKKAAHESGEFILKHRLFRSHRTGEVITPGFIRLCYPCRWYYDILRALDYFRLAKVQYDERMDDALQIIRNKRSSDGTWKLPAAYPGQVHFTMEKSGQPSRWNTLRAMRVLGFFS